MLKILNRSLNLRLIRKRTLQSIFKILANESNTRSRELDLSNRFIFDFFFKNNLVNFNFLGILLKDRFYSISNFFKARLFYFFFNFGIGLFFFKNNELSLFKNLVLKKQFISVFFKGSNLVGDLSSNLFFWGLNLSFSNLKSINIDVEFIESQNKDYLHEEGKLLLIQKVFYSKLFFVRIFNRKYHISVFKNLLKFNSTIFQIYKFSGFNFLLIYFLFLFIHFLMMFFYYYIFSMVSVLIQTFSKIKI
jgi:hypothetical protein